MSDFLLGAVLFVQILVVLNLWRLNVRMDTCMKIVNDARRVSNHIAGKLGNLIGIAKKE